jgi:hypothetical protein
MMKLYASVSETSLSAITRVRHLSMKSCSEGSLQCLEKLLL